MLYHSAPDVQVRSVSPMPSDWHARFNCKGREYVYVIWTAVDRRRCPVFWRNRVWDVRGRLDDQAMDSAAQALVGFHNFSAFRHSGCQAASPWRTLTALRVTKYPPCEELSHLTFCGISDDELRENILFVHAKAPSFLYRQVRSLVGLLKVVGEGRLGFNDVMSILYSGARARCPPPAPAHGLFLVNVHY